MSKLRLQFVSFLLLLGLSVFGASLGVNHHSQQGALQPATLAANAHLNSATILADGGDPPAPPMPLPFSLDGGDPPAPPMPLPHATTLLSLDGGDPPAPPMPLPFSLDGGDPPAPPMPLPHTTTLLSLDGGDPPAPPMPLPLVA
jgi:hypothetical protein